MFDSFIKQYKRIFPIFTVFDEFEMADRNDFG